jgi:hypothetical protein
MDPANALKSIFVFLLPRPFIKMVFSTRFLIWLGDSGCVVSASVDDYIGEFLKHPVIEN